MDPEGSPPRGESDIEGGKGKTIYWYTEYRVQYRLKVGAESGECFI
jgi:hypothetical protein